MSDSFTLSFDPKALAEIAQFYGFPVLLDSEVQQAMSDAGDLLVQAGANNAQSRFAQNSPGGLADELHKVADSPYELQVGNTLPYAHRRDQGFVGADSLGRVYNDQPYLYLTDALNDNEQAVLQLIEAAAERALNKLGGSA